MRVIITQLNSLTNPRIPDFAEFVREFVSQSCRNSSRTDRYSDVFVSDERREEEITLILRIADIDRYSGFYGEGVDEGVYFSAVSCGDDEREVRGDVFRRECACDSVSVLREVWGELGTYGEDFGSAR